MHQSTVQEEYSALYREYSSMVFSIVLPDSLTNPVRITTAENTVLDTRLEHDGWTVVALTATTGSKPLVKKGAVFETPEALLMNVSPVFAQRWNATLTARLEAAFS